MESGVYKITNLVNGKIYVGGSIELNKRKRFHFYELRKGIHRNQHLQKSFIKYGEENFIFEVLEYCYPEECIIREQYFMDLYTPISIDGLYNMCKVAGSHVGLKCSEETKRKIGKANSGRPMTEKHKEALRLINTGKKASEETRRKQSKVQKGKVMSEEARKKISLGLKGKIISDAHRLAMSIAKRGIKKNPMKEETKAKLRISAKSRPKISEETRQRLSNSHKGKIQSKELIAKRNDKIQKKVIQYDIENNVIFIHDSIKKAAESVGVKAPNISACLSNGQRKSKGFIFKYFNQ